MGYRLQVLLVYWVGIWDRGYGLQVYRDGYGLEAMGYGLPVLLVYRDGIWDMAIWGWVWTVGYGIWNTATAGILG